MLKSAQNFAAGFFGIPAEDQYHLEVTVEAPGFNNTLAPWNTVRDVPRRDATLISPVRGRLGLWARGVAEAKRVERRLSQRCRAEGPGDDQGVQPSSPRCKGHDGHVCVRGESSAASSAASLQPPPTTSPLHFTSPFPPLRGGRARLTGQTVALGYSAFCDLFTRKEWRGYEYSMDVWWWYSSSFGYPKARAQGKGWATELISRLTKSASSACSRGLSDGD